MAEIVVSGFMDERAVDELRADFDVRYDPQLAGRPEALSAAVANARGLIVRNRTQVRGELLAAAKHLEVVGCLGVGLDNIDLDACRARGIAVCPATGANESAVAEYVIAATLALLRGAFSASPAMIAGGWPREALIGREVAGRTMGLVGFGAIARQVSSRCSALGMNVAAYDPYLPASDPAWQQARRHERLPELLGVADVVNVHVLLNETTRRLIDASALAAMRAGAVLINTSRGGIVDERALAAALRAGKLGGAALDVFEREPLAGEDAAVFAGCPN